MVYMRHQQHIQIITGGKDATIRISAPGCEWHCYLSWLQRLWRVERRGMTLIVLLTTINHLIQASIRVARLS